MLVYDDCSVGEPSTQMTLNTFHFAGMSCLLHASDHNTYETRFIEVMVPLTSRLVSHVFEK